MRFNGTRGDSEPVGDRLGRKPTGHQPENVSFPWGKTMSNEP
jgi:hypothetical protein